MSQPSLMTIAAHADDVELNFAATMLKYHQEKNYYIWYVMSTNNMSGGWSEALVGERAGMSAMPDWVQPRVTISETDQRIVRRVPWYHEMAQRKRETANSARDCFGTVPIHLDYAQRHYTDRNLQMVDLRYGAPIPDCYDPEIPTIMTACDEPAEIEKVAQLILDKNPEVIFTHPAVDYTFEHTGTTLLVKKAFIEAQQRGYDGSLILSAAPGKNKMGRFYDRWDTFINTTGYMEGKLDAVGKHACQIPFPEHWMCFDPYAARIMGIDGTIEPFVVVRLSGTRTGELTDELRANHRHCNENWMEFFFSEKSEAIYKEFEDTCQQRHDALVAALAKSEKVKKN